MAGIQLKQIFHSQPYFPCTKTQKERKSIKTVTQRQDSVSVFVISYPTLWKLVL